MSEVLFNPIAEAISAYNLESLFSVETSDEAVPKAIADVVSKGKFVKEWGRVSEDGVLSSDSTNSGDGG